MELIVAIGAIIVAVVLVPLSLYLEYRTGFFAASLGRKELSIRLVFASPLASVKTNFKGKVKIYYDNQPVEDAWLVVLKITNTGRKEITPTDFDKPITVSFKSRHLVDATITNSNLKPLENKWIFSDTVPEARLQKMLLNEGDFLTTAFLISELNYDDDTPLFEYTGRIVGGKIVRRYERVIGIDILDHLARFVINSIPGGPIALFILLLVLYFLTENIIFLFANLFFLLMTTLFSLLALRMAIFWGPD